MTAPLCQELPYHRDSWRLFQPIADEPWAVFLDSGGRGRYDIIAAAPVATITVSGGEILLERSGRAEPVAGSPFTVMRELLGPAAPPGELPFSGGLLGYFGYDLGRPGNALPPAARSGGLPDMALGLYDWAVVVDHEAQRCWLAGQGRHEATRRDWSALHARFSQPVPPAGAPALRATGPFRTGFDRARYGVAFRQVQSYLAAGDCYQVNLAQRFAIPVAGDPRCGYADLRTLSPAPFGAYLNLPFARILCNSPERFLRVAAGQVETRPIKGTRPRGATPTEDMRLADELVTSAKDRAENLMIVDLLRNDLGKVCRTGTVRVPELFTLESYATVHHLVSSIRGELRPGLGAVDLLEACLPGGSITGAPKRRAMEIIDELEPVPREVYCGAIGYLGFDGGMDTNIAIRTAVHQDDTLRFWAGGGIVTDSAEGAEYQECLEKARAWFRLLDIAPE